MQTNKVFSCFSASKRGKGDKRPFWKGVSWWRYHGIGQRKRAPLPKKEHVAFVMPMHHRINTCLNKSVDYSAGASLAAVSLCRMMPRLRMSLRFSSSCCREKGRKGKQCERDRGKWVRQTVCLPRTLTTCSSSPPQQSHPQDKGSGELVCKTCTLNHTLFLLPLPRLFTTLPS